MLKFSLPIKCPQHRVGVTSHKASKVSKASKVNKVKKSSKPPAKLKVSVKKEKNSKMVYDAVLDILRTSHSTKFWVNTLVKMIGDSLRIKNIMIVVDRQAVLKAIHRLESCQCVQLSSEEFVRVTEHFFAEDIQAWKNRFLAVPART